MFCTSCGKQNANTFGFCNYCGKPLTPPPGTVSGPTATAAQQAVVTQTVNVRGKRNPAVMVVIAIIVAAAVGGIVFVTMNVDRESPDQRVSRLMREAAGLQPVKKAFFSSDRQFDDAFREQFSNLFRVNREMLSQASQIDERELAKVGTPESFADPSYAAEGLKQLHKSLDIDQQMEQKVGEIVNNLRHAIETTDWSASQKEQALAGFERGLAPAMEKRNRLVDAERHYVDSADDLYAYAGEHHSDFVMNNGHISIADAAVLQGFNSKIRQYNAYRGDLLRAKDDFTRFQSDLLKKMNVGGKDVGLQ
ncbi:MAG TPA: zinc ribbon domain-containing protein [Candidatus Angelobacter sp.]|nr:zinc ribbon domain-containing protein [Candidatus Angelobacter sp.]